MRKSMLTYETLDRFETLVDTSKLSAEQIKKIEFNAYWSIKIGNRSRKGKGKVVNYPWVMKDEPQIYRNINRGRAENAAGAD